MPPPQRKPFSPSTTWPSKEILRQSAWHLLNLDIALFTPQFLEFYGNINFLKGALVIGRQNNHRESDLRPGDHDRWSKGSASKECCDSAPAISSAF